MSGTAPTPKMGVHSLSPAAGSDAPSIDRDPTMSKRAVIVVDLQNDYFPTGKLPLAGIEQAADHGGLTG